MKKQSPELSKGYVILAMLLVLMIAGSSFVLAGLNNRQSSYLSQQRELHQQLETAKANLLAYATINNDFFAEAQGPGFFPCPDTNNDGYAEASCDPPATNPTLASCYSNVSRPVPITGRLPKYVINGQKRHALSDYGSGTDQQFWYVVAPRYIYHLPALVPASNLTNATARLNRRLRNRSSILTSFSPAPGCMRMHIDDATSTPLGQYVALIIAPGEALDIQDRNSNMNLVSNYLDGLNPSGNFYFYSSYESNPSEFNDQVIGITLNEYMLAVGTKVAVKMKKVLDAKWVTNGNSYPSSITSQFDSEAVWLQRSSVSTYNGERWSSDTTYTKVSSSKATLKFSGCTGIVFTLDHTANSVTHSSPPTC